MKKKGTPVKIRCECAADLRASRHFLKKTAVFAMKEAGIKGELSVLLTDNEFIAGLNRKYLSKDAPTDVLAFPMNSGGMAGDIVISVQMAAEQAAEYGQSVEAELARLLIHGILHLSGFDDAQKKERRRMEKRQEEILEKALGR